MVCSLVKLVDHLCSELSVVELGMVSRCFKVWSPVVFRCGLRVFSDVFRCGLRMFSRCFQVCSL